MMRRFAKTVSAVLAGCAALVSLSVTASAQEIQVTGPLAGAPALRYGRQHRAGRFEVALSSSFTLLDQYERTIAPGGTLTYHFTDWIGISVFGAYGLQYTTGLTDQIQTNAIGPGGPQSYNCAARPWIKACQLTAVNLTRGNMGTDQLAHMTWMLAPQVVAVPFRGKLSLFSALFLDADVDVFAGAMFTGLKERADCGHDTADKALPIQCSDQASFTLAQRVAIAPTFGLGLNFYPASPETNFFGVGFEFRAFPFSWNTSGFDNHGNHDQFPDQNVNSNDREFHFNTMLTVQLKFAFPVSIKKSP